MIANTDIEKQQPVRDARKQHPVQSHKQHPLQREKGCGLLPDLGDPST